MQTQEALVLGEDFYEEKIRLEYGDPSVIRAAFNGKDSARPHLFESIYNELNKTKGNKISNSITAFYRQPNNFVKPFSLELLKFYIEHCCHVAIKIELDKSELANVISQKKKIKNEDRQKLLEQYQKIIKCIVMAANNFNSQPMLDLIHDAELNPYHLKDELTEFKKTCLLKEQVSEPQGNVDRRGP